MYNINRMKTVGYLFKSLYKNDVCIEAGRKFKWWFALILFLLSTIISLIPISVSSLTVDGGTIITSSTYEVDNALVAFASEKLVNNTYVFNLTNSANKKNDSVQNDDEKNTLTIENHSNTDYSTPLFTWSGYYSSTNEETNITEDKERKILEVYDFTYFGLERTTKSTTSGEVIVGSFADAVNLVSKGVALPSDPDLVAQTYDDLESSTTSTRTTSFLAFGKYNFVLYKYNSQGTLTQSISGDYVYINANTINELFKSEYVTTTYINWDKIIESWVQVFREGYYSTKNRTAAIEISIILGVNAGIILLMSLIIFLVTRGKNNPFRIYKYYECLKICCWLSLSPALLTLIFGFILSSTFGMFIFVLTFGVRAMFMWSKNLRVYKN